MHVEHLVVYLAGNGFYSKRGGAQRKFRDLRSPTDSGRKDTFVSLPSCHWNMYVTCLPLYLIIFQGTGSLEVACDAQSGQGLQGHS